MKIGTVRPYGRVWGIWNKKLKKWFAPGYRISFYHTQKDAVEEMSEWSFKCPEVWTVRSCFLAKPAREAKP